MNNIFNDKSKGPMLLALAVILIIGIVYLGYQRTPASFGLKVTEGATNGKSSELPGSLSGTVKKGKYVIFVSNDHVIDSSRVHSGNWDVYTDTDGDATYGFLYVTDKHYDTTDYFQEKDALASEKIVFTKGAIQAEKESGDNTVSTNDQDSDKNDGSDDESTSEPENTSSNSSSTESKASVSSKTDNVSESLSAFKQSVQKRVENQSTELSKADVDDKTNGVTYTASPTVTRYDQFKLQKLASDLFSGTQGIARMCDIPTPIPITLNSANGNILARYKLNGDIKVYPQN